MQSINFAYVECALITGQVEKLLAVKNAPPQTPVRFVHHLLTIMCKEHHLLLLYAQVKLDPADVKKLIQKALAIFKEEVIFTSL